jgi:glycogen operon protein
MASGLATRLCGSSDLYQWNGRLPRHSINFVTCHDGFTLYDLVSYNHKHNEANGEGNRDGANDNHSWNSGAEGETDDVHVYGLRRRRAKNLMATLLLSQGVPMILAGDEFLRTQRGNNNAWCQDNDIGWVNWDLANRNADFLRFVREMIWLRKRHPALRRQSFFRGRVAWDKHWSDVEWHGQWPFRPDWGPGSTTLAYTLDGRFTGREPDRDFYVACNGGWENKPFRVPPSPSGRPWRRIVDTALAAPLDIVSEDEGPHVAEGTTLYLMPYSLVILISEE